MDDTVVIVGGGYGGVALAKALDADFRVVLVDPKDAFVHAVAALRGLVDEDWAPSVFFPYDRLLERGRFVRDCAAAVDATGVTTAGGQRIDADYVVLASGSSYPYPAKMDVDDAASALAKLSATRAELERAERVLLVGGGPVGLELAGEIDDRWPGKQITIVDVAEDILAGRYSEALRAELRAQLADRGVRLVLGAPLATEPEVPPGRKTTFTVKTDRGVNITADIWFRCHGVVPTSDYLREPLARRRTPNGAVEVDEYLRVAGQRNVFAIGDVTAIPEPKRASAAVRHAGVVAANIGALAGAAGGQPQTTYQPGPSGLVVPLGAKGGASELHRPEGTLFLGPDETAEIKGKDLMVSRYAEQFGVTPSPRQPGFEPR